MRIIEPHNFEKSAKQRRNHKLSRWLIVVGLFLLLTIPAALLANRVVAPQINEAQISSQAATSANVAGTQTTATSPKQFSSQQFKALYESLALPNTETIPSAPEITGNTVADERIRTLAEARGYSLRSVPVLPIVKTATPGLDEDDLLQPKAFAAYQALQRKAAQDQIPLQLSSGYRSIDWQRQYFLQQLRTRGLTTAAIASRRADAGLKTVMSVVAPPGYSRHHTGYAIDLVCHDGSGRPFEYTSCFNWLSKDNYKIAKQFGWIPSYPEGAKEQGPEPEPWEYVWVGTEATYESR